MKVGFFFSGGASSLRAAYQNHLHKKKYEIIFAFTDREEASGIKFCQQVGLPLIVIDYKKFCQKRNLNPYNLKDRPFYFDEVLKKIAPFGANLIGLSGFMLIVTEPLLSFYKDHIFNIHPFRLDILCGAHTNRLEVGELESEEVEKLVVINKLERKYKGEDAIYDGMISGEPYAQSSLHLATALFDEGPILVMSKKVYFDQVFVKDCLKRRNFRPLRIKADVIQEQMKWECDSPAFIKAIELVADSRIRIEGKTIFLDGKPLPYKGFSFEE